MFSIGFSGFLVTLIRCVYKYVDSYEEGIELLAVPEDCKLLHPRFETHRGLIEKHLWEEKTHWHEWKWQNSDVLWKSIDINWKKLTSMDQTLATVKAVASMNGKQKNVEIAEKRKASLLMEKAWKSSDVNGKALMAIDLKPKVQTCCFCEPQMEPMCLPGFLIRPLCLKYFFRHHNFTFSAVFSIHINTHLPPWRLQFLLKCLAERCHVLHEKHRSDMARNKDSPPYLVETCPLRHIQPNPLPNSQRFMIYCNKHSGFLRSIAAEMACDWKKAGSSAYPEKYFHDALSTCTFICHCLQPGHHIV